MFRARLIWWKKWLAFTATTKSRPTLPRGVNPLAGRSLSQRLEEKAKSAILRCDLSEVVTLSMTNAAAVARAGMPSDEAVMLRNPLSEDFTQMRTSLVPSLLEVLARNVRGGARISNWAAFICRNPARNSPTNGFVSAWP
jgi:phenylalanyl-tRNA synthetase beta subunit